MHIGVVQKSYNFIKNYFYFLKKHILKKRPTIDNNMIKIKKEKI